MREQLQMHEEVRWCILFDVKEQLRTSQAHQMYVRKHARCGSSNDHSQPLVANAIVEVEHIGVAAKPHAIPGAFETVHEWTGKVKVAKLSREVHSFLDGFCARCRVASKRTGEVLHVHVHLRQIVRVEKFLNGTSDHRKATTRAHLYESIHIERQSLDINAESQNEL